MYASRSGNILFYFFFADNFTGSKDTEPYKTDVSFLCQCMYMYAAHLQIKLQMSDIKQMTKS